MMPQSQEEMNKQCDIYSAFEKEGERKKKNTISFSLEKAKENRLAI